MGKYEKPKTAKVKKHKKKMKVGLKVILIILLILLLLFLAVGGFLWAKLDLIQYDDEIDHSVYFTEPEATGVSDESTEESDLMLDLSGLDMIDGELDIPDSEIQDSDNVLNILLIGTDERSKEFNTNARSDSMIIVSIDKDNNTVKLVSLERGMAVPVLAGIYEGQYDWLTHIFRYGGADLLVETVEYCFKIDIDHYVRVNFNSVTQVVDTIGGIEMDLTKAEASYLGMSDNSLKEGTNVLDGRMALAYARLREIDSDWQRVQRQRKVILAIVEKLKGSSLMDLNNLADDVLPLIQTNMSKLQIAELVLYAPNFLQASFDQRTIPEHGTYGGMTMMGGRVGYALDFDVNNAILHEFLYGTED